jgi:hypothetical protein
MKKLFFSLILSLFVFVATNAQNGSFALGVDMTNYHIEFGASCFSNGEAEGSIFTTYIVTQDANMQVQESRAYNLYTIWFTDLSNGEMLGFEVYDTPWLQGLGIYWALDEFTPRGTYTYYGHYYGY